MTSQPSSDDVQPVPREPVEPPGANLDEIVDDIDSREGLDGVDGVDGADAPTAERDAPREQGAAPEPPD